MAFSTLTKSYVNHLLKHLNLRLDTLTAEKLETQRLCDLERLGQFERPVFPVPAAFEQADSARTLQEVGRYQDRFDDFSDPSRNDVRYTYNNAYFTSPDAEVLYAIIRSFRPRTVVEVGCGNSTQITRQAIIDGELDTRLICVDPYPRTEIAALADELHRVPVQELEGGEVFRSLEAGDVLFIDSSHELRAGSDAVFLYSKVIPALPPGVLIHIHDIFLPYDYPKEWVIDDRAGRGHWNEQYLVQALLIIDKVFETLWAGHYLQHTLSDFTKYFPHSDGRAAKSLWLRKIS